MNTILAVALATYLFPALYWALTRNTTIGPLEVLWYGFGTRGALAAGAAAVTWLLLTG